MAKYVNISIKWNLHSTKLQL